MLVLTVMMLAFPHLSGDYKLIHLYIPFGMILLGAVPQGLGDPPPRWRPLVLLGIIFSPKSYQFGQYSIGYLINGASWPS